MTRGVVGTMSTFGFVTEPQLKIALKIDYWFEARKNQSIIIPEVETYQFIKESVQGTNISLDDFCELIQTSLRTVLLEAFDDVTIDVRHENVSPNGSMFRCFISGTVVENGVGYDISKAVSINNNTFEKINEGRHGKI